MHIQENPETEKTIRLSARREARSLIKQLKQDNLESTLAPAVIELATRNGGTRFFPVSYCVTSYPDLAVGIMYDGSSWGITGLKTHENKSTFPENINYLIVIPASRIYRYPKDASLSSMMDIAKTLATSKYFLIANIEENFSSFLHEFTHYWNFSQAKSFRSTHSKNRSEYFNNPLEVNAYFQEAVNKISKNPKWFLLPFKEFLAKALRSFLREFLDHMNDDTKKRVLTRLYVLWEHERTEKGVPKQS